MEVNIDGKTYVPKGTENKLQMAKLKKGLTFCIVRTYSAGVFAGWIDRKIKGKDATIYNSRRLYYWDGAFTLSTVATKGVFKRPICCRRPFRAPFAQLSVRIPHNGPMSFGHWQALPSMLNEEKFWVLSAPTVQEKRLPCNF